jgi:hypothetical protein
MSPHTVDWLHRFGTVAVCCTGFCLAAQAAPDPKKVAPHPTPKLDAVTRLDLRLPPPRDLSSDERFTGFARAGEMHPQSFHLSEGEDRSVGRVQALAERFRREGLPVARLWENHAALLSLGLNSKGKPGIWLVQKTH